MHPLIDAIRNKNKIKVDLVSNFYSFGEMAKDNFDIFMNSSFIKNSINLYFCNRYDSAPFYEKTYEENYSILDYLMKEFKIILNRSSGIHNYMMPIRKYNGVKKSRPISSGYFELIQNN